MRKTAHALQNNFLVLAMKISGGTLPFICDSKVAATVDSPLNFLAWYKEESALGKCILDNNDLFILSVGMNIHPVKFSNFNILRFFRYLI